MAVSLTWTFPERFDPARETSSARSAPAPEIVTPSTSEPPLADLAERALVEACLAGRPGAFDLVVERHRRSVYQLCYRFVSNHEDASDLSQDVFLRAFRGLKNFKGNSSLGTWLYRIGVNVCLNRLSLKTPINEPIEERHYAHLHSESPADRVLRNE